MLFLTRRLGETIVMEGAGRIEVQVVHIRRGVVRLGIEAPPDVSIQRGENIRPAHDHQEVSQ